MDELLENNPWWIDYSAIKSDPAIKSWNDSELKWVPRLSKTFAAEDCIYSLRGPRQVGKTTLVKLKIAQDLKTVPKWNVMYYSFELENSPRDVLNVLNEYFNRTMHNKHKRHFIYLDEISNIRDWQKAIKKLKDQGKLENCTIIVTGSHSIDLRRSTELLPGRRGFPSCGTLDKILLPMKFGEFALTTDKQLKTAMERHMLLAEDRLSVIRKLANGILDERLMELSAFQNDLDRHFENYLLVGGMPAVVNEFLKNGFIRDSVYRTYVDAIMGSLQRMGKDESYVEQLVPNVIKSITTPMSWDSLKKDSEIGSHHTVDDYVKTLSGMFVLFMLYRYNSITNRPKFDSLKKIFFYDPFFMHALNGYVSQTDSYRLSVKTLDSPETKSKITEQVVADHCLRMAFSMTSNKMGFSHRSSVFYWKSKTSREVDFVVRDNDTLIPIEVKYQNQIKRDDLYGLIDFKKATKIDRGFIITKNKLQVENGTVLIPASLFLLLV